MAWRAALGDLVRPAALLAGTGLALATALPAGRLPAAPAATRPASQCRAGEQVIYSCRFGTAARSAIGSICGAGDKVHYRFGPAGRPALALSSEADWANIHTGQVRGQGGGYQEHVRFTAGQTHYIVFRGEDGALASRPGRTYSGIAVQDPGAGERTLACRAGARIAGSLVEAVTLLAPPEAELGEIDDGPFDAWF